MLRRTTISTLVLAFVTLPVAAQSTSFNYQGQLKQDGRPVSGSVDMEFRVFDAAEGGLMIVPSYLVADIVVENGLFGVDLDFGEDLFAAEEQWLEVAVRYSGGGGDYEPLLPRQKLNGAPYAHFAYRDGKWTRSNDVITNEAGFVGINRDYVVGSEYFGVHAPIETGYGGMYLTTDGEEARPFYGYFTGSEVGWHYLDGATGDWHLNLAGIDRMTLTRNGRLGVGTDQPQAMLHVGGNYTPTVGSSVGVVAGTFAADGTVVSDGGQVLSRSPSGQRAASMEVDASADSGGDAWYMVSHASISPFGGAAGSFSLYKNGTNYFNLNDAGRVGIRTTTPEAQVHVATGSDVNPSSGGFIQTGNVTGQNIGIDSNEIMARDNGAAADLYLQNEGGNVLVGPAGTSRFGLGTTDPQASVHVQNLSLDVSSSAIESEDLVVESNDATLGLYSSAAGSWGSVLTMREMNNGALANSWSIARRTSGGGGALHFTYGPNVGPAANPTLMRLDTVGRVDLGESIELYATEGGSDGAQVRLRDAADVATFEVDAEENGGGSVQLMRNSAGETTVEIDADESDDSAIYLDRADGSRRIELRSDVSSAGWIATRGSNGDLNVVITRENASSNHGWIDVSDASGNPQAGAYVNSSGNGVIWGDTKNFRIPHPRDPNSDIWYASVEGPEAAAYIRGTSELKDGRATVTLPDHFKDVSVADGMTVQLTPRSGASKGLAVVTRSLEQFSVVELFDGDGSYEFDWEVKAVRRGHENFRVIRGKTEIARLLPQE